MAHTYLTYFKRCHVHHIDENPLNNCLINLKVLTPHEHMTITNIGRFIGKVHSDASRKNMSKGRKGKESTFKGHCHSEESKKRISEARKGKILSEEWKEHIRKGMIGVNVGKVGHFQSETTRKKIGEASKGNTNVLGHFWWTNGIISKLSKECPDEGWFRGRIINKNK